MSFHDTQDRHGITITETLAAIAVAAVGLFAVVAVIPFATRQAESGLNADVSVNVGKDAFRDFDIRGMGRVDNWRLANGVKPPATFWPGKSFVIDPLYITRNDATANPAIGAFPFSLYFNDARLADNSRAYALDRLNLTALNRIYSYPHADSIFRSPNELMFADPVDKLNLPDQQMKLVDPSLADNPRNPANWLKRKTAGSVSWMAMVVPESALAANANPHMYRLYIIVFHGRQLNYKATGASGEALYRGIVQGNGRGGGVVDMVLADPSELPVPNDPRTGNRLVQDDYLNAGDWVLLSDHFQYQSTYANWQSNSGGAWRWYQIQRVDPADPNSQNGVIRTTLVGPDWTGQDVDVSTPNVWDVHAIVLSNVLAVYEKTIRIEYESIWND